MIIKKGIMLGLLVCMSSLVYSESNNQVSQKLLSRLLANHGVLLFQTLNYHWNIEGKEFHDYHLLFDTQYRALFANLDLIAERIRAVGGKSLGSMKDFAKYATLKEDSNTNVKPQKMIVNLHSQYAAIIDDMKRSVQELEKTDDVATRKMLEDLIEMHEKTKWMLNSLTKNK